jgi:hypothetical protein
MPSCFEPARNGQVPGYTGSFDYHNSTPGQSAEHSPPTLLPVQQVRSNLSLWQQPMRALTSRHFVGCLYHSPRGAWEGHALSAVSRETHCAAMHKAGDRGVASAQVSHIAEPT